MTSDVPDRTIDLETEEVVSFAPRTLLQRSGEDVLGWRGKQLPDGTLILTSPSGHTYVTTPGSALLFPPPFSATCGYFRSP